MKMSISQIINRCANPNCVREQLASEHNVTIVSEQFTVTGVVMGKRPGGKDMILPIQKPYRLLATQSLVTMSGYTYIRETARILLEKNSLVGTLYMPQQFAVLLCINTITTIAIQEHLFTNESPSFEFIGNLIDGQEEALQIALNGNESAHLLAMNH